MKTTNHLSAYPVFIMWEQLNLNGFFENNKLDEMWELSCENYNTFLNSDFNDSNQSEYDCIVFYVNNLIN